MPEIRRQGVKGNEVTGAKKNFWGNGNALHLEVLFYRYIHLPKFTGLSTLSLKFTLNLYFKFKIYYM